MSYAQAFDRSKAQDKRTEAELLAGIQRDLAAADETSTRTLQTLDGQTEQLHRIGEHSADIENNLDQSEWLLRGLKRFGLLRNLFSKEPQTPQRPPPTLRTSGGYPSAGGAAGSTASGASSAPPAAPGQGGAQDRAAQRLLADEAARRARANNSGAASGHPGLQRDAETEKAYNNIDHLLDGLTQKSLEISKTLDQHNKMLPGITDSVDRSQDRIGKQKQSMKKLIS